LILRMQQRQGRYGIELIIEVVAKLRKQRSFGSFSIGIKKYKKLTLRSLTFLYFLPPIEKSLKIPLFS
jgi:hypothetical protein